jgi:serine/threonine-protein phosphatase with EF-hand domain
MGCTSSKEAPNVKKLKKKCNDEVIKTKAATTIIKQHRKNQAAKAAHDAVLWKMFSDLDTQDEAETLELAVFMQTLIDLVPTTLEGPEGSSSLDESSTPRDDHHDDESPSKVIPLTDCKQESWIELEDVEVMEKAHSMRRDHTGQWNVVVSIISPQVAIDIIRIFKRGGKLTRKAVVRLLREGTKMLKGAPNINRVKVSEGGKMTVVGDLHGQLSDLFYILGECGMPNEKNKFVFNGDFVDRGESGVEIVCVLLALFIAYGPEVVSLNRGNHEDGTVCRVYGFEQEVKKKYDERLAKEFMQFFNHLQLFVVISDSVFVVHGGLFHTPSVTLQDLEDIDRTDFSVKPQAPYPANCKGLCEADKKLEYCKQLQREALWSDPMFEKGCYLSPRGAGVLFGPDIAQKFMTNNKLDMVIRAHECVQQGYDLPYLADDGERHSWNIKDEKYKKLPDPAGTPFLCTLFSASNYGGGENHGAYLQLCTHPFNGSFPADCMHGKGDKQPPLHYSVYSYQTSSQTKEEVEEFRQTSLRELILKKKPALMSAFEGADKNSDWKVTRIEWSDIMKTVTGIKILWLSIIDSIAPVECLSPSSVDYKKFLNHYSLYGTASGRLAPSDHQKVLMDQMYGQRRKLESIFKFFDQDDNGSISHAEFRDGCAKLNEALPPDCQLHNVDTILKLMDFDASGSIDLNEFFETFRILDAKDGIVDGIISYESWSGPKKAN